MKRTLLTSLFLLGTALGAHADKVVVYNRDSKDPNVGWHWVNGMRTCTQDCDNPAIPGSGYTCTYRSDGWRECVK